MLLDRSRKRIGHAMKSAWLFLVQIAFLASNAAIAGADGEFLTIVKEPNRC